LGNSIDLARPFSTYAYTDSAVIACEDAKETGFSFKDLRGLQQAFCVAKKVAERVGSGQILLGTLQEFS
jgi:hypothetical protein